MLPCVITTLKVKVYTGKSDLLPIIFYYYLSDNIKKSNRVSASVGHTEHVLINYMVIPEYIRAKRRYYFILQPLECINGVYKLAASRIISVVLGTHIV